MCLKIEKSNIGKHSKRKYVYKIVLAGSDGSFGNVFVTASPTKFNIGEKIKSNRNRVDLEDFEKCVGEVRLGFHTFVSLVETIAFIKDCESTYLIILKCAVDQKDHVVDGLFATRATPVEKRYVSAVYMSLTPIEVIEHKEKRQLKSFILK